MLELEYTITLLVVFVSIGFVFLRYRGHRIDEFKAPNEEQKNAARYIWRIWLAYRARTTFNFEDLRWLHYHNIALRNVSEKKGVEERRFGGRGDAYSLSTFGFNHTERDIEGITSQERAFFKKLYELVSLDKPHLDGSIFDRSAVYKRLLNDTIPTSVQKIFTQKLNKYLLHMIKNCFLVFPKCHDGDMFHLMRLESASNSRDISSNLTYPTGKCGTSNFEATDIVDSISSGQYLLPKDVQDSSLGVGVVFGGRRIPSNMKQEGMCLCLHDYANKKPASLEHEKLVDSESRFIAGDLVRCVKRERKQTPLGKDKGFVVQKIYDRLERASPDFA